ncbi:RxLR effector protein, partial [Phytophthora megakarya]
MGYSNIALINITILLVAAIFSVTDANKNIHGEPPPTRLLRTVKIHSDEERIAGFTNLKSI